MSASNRCATAAAIGTGGDDGARTEAMEPFDLARRGRRAWLSQRMLDPVLRQIAPKSTSTGGW
jgi:hypothetical protein